MSWYGSERVKTVLITRLRVSDSLVTRNGAVHPQQAKVALLSADLGTTRVPVLTARAHSAVHLPVQVQSQAERVATVAVGDELKVGCGNKNKLCSHDPNT